MSITVYDCLKLKSLSKAKVIAGANGLNNFVVSVSVLEYAVPEYLSDNYFRNNELVISALISIKDDVKAQCNTIKILHDVGEVGLILYYVGKFIPSVHPSLIEVADNLNFPIICMPENNCDLRYSEVICDVMEAIFNDKLNETYFVGEFIERISKLNIHMRTMDSVLRMLSDRLHCFIFLADRNYNLLSQAFWPNDDMHIVNTILNYFKESFLKFNSNDYLFINHKGETLYVNNQYVFIDYGFELNLIIGSSKQDFTIDECKQSAEIVRLFINIWSQNEGNERITELMKAILNDEPIKMRRLAEIFNINVSKINTMWIIKAKQIDNEKILLILSEFLKIENKIFIVDIFEKKVVAFLDENSSKKAIDLAQSFALKLKTFNINAPIAISNNLENTADVRKSYIFINQYLSYAIKIFPIKTILINSEIDFSYECLNIIKEGENSIDTCLAHIKLIKEEDIKTLSVYLLDANNSVDETAKFMFVHKNTIKYRLKKIREKLGYDINKMPEVYKLYLAVATKRLLEKI